MSESANVNDKTKIYLLPNLFTAGNLFFGFLSMIKSIQAKYCLLERHDYYMQSVWCIFLAFVCDGLDGRIARLGGKETLFGKEFDSIADVVSFGVAPSMMVFFILLSPTEGYPFFRKIGWLIGFIYLLCGAVRLARFNVITHPLLVEQKLVKDYGKKDFVGLPIPVAAGLIASLVLVISRFNLREWALLLPGLMLLIAWLMISTVRFPSFKDIDWNTEAKMKTFIFGVIIFAAIYLFREFSFALVFITYVSYGLIRHVRRYFKKTDALKNSKKGE